MFDDRGITFRLAESTTLADWPIPEPIARELRGRTFELVAEGNEFEVTTWIQRVIGEQYRTGRIVGRAEDRSFWLAVSTSGPENAVGFTKVIDGYLIPNVDDTVTVVAREALPWWPVVFLTAFSICALVGGIVSALAVLDLRGQPFGEPMGTRLLGGGIMFTVLIVALFVFELVRDKMDSPRTALVATIRAKGQIDPAMLV